MEGEAEGDGKDVAAAEEVEDKGDEENDKKVEEADKGDEESDEKEADNDNADVEEEEGGGGDGAAKKVLEP